MFDWHSTKDHSMIPSTYVELEPLIFSLWWYSKREALPSGRIPRVGGWLPELANPKTGAVSSEFGCPEDRWWGSVGPGETAPLKKKMHHH